MTHMEHVYVDCPIGGCDDPRLPVEVVLTPVGKGKVQASAAPGAIDETVRDHLVAAHPDAELPAHLKKPDDDG